jgi:general secretion pathway protein I
MTAQFTTRLTVVEGGGPPRRRARRYGQTLPAGTRAFTLVEVLVALAVVAVALLACMRAVGVMAQSGSELEGRLLAQLSARNQLALLRASRAFPSLGTTGFACPQGELALRCEQETRTTPNEFFRRVHVRVYLESQPDHRLDARGSRSLQGPDPPALRGRRQSLPRHRPPLGRRDHRPGPDPRRPRPRLQRLPERPDPRTRPVRHLQDVMRAKAQKILPGTGRGTSRRLVEGLHRAKRQIC